MYKATNHYIIKKKQKIKEICIYETLNHVKECASRRSYGRSALQARKKHCFGTRFGTGNGGARPPRAASPCAPEWRGASGSDSVPLPRLSEIVIARGSVFRVLPGYKAQRKFRIFLVSKSEMQQPTSLHPN